MVSEDGVAQGQPLGRDAHARPELNHLRPGDRPVHDWYRFVLSFPPHLVADYLERFGLDGHSQLLDPFCGTGTTVVEGKKRCIPSQGIEANPMAWFAGSVKGNWAVDPVGLWQQAEAIAAAATAAIAQAPAPLRTLPPEAQKLILANSISPLPLHKTLILLETLEAMGAEPYRAPLRLALARAIVTTIGNLRFGPEVGVGKAKADAPVVAAWLGVVETMAADLAQVQDRAGVPVWVHRGDARQVLSLLPEASIDAVITSPPYPNEKDYTRTTRLELVLLGFINNRAELRQLKEGLLRSNTRNVFKGDQDDLWVSKHKEIQRIAAEIAARSEARRAERGKISGFERLYPRAVTLYFGGMAKHLADLRSRLRPGAQLAYVVGDQRSYHQVMIRTGELLASLGEGLGYEVVGIDLFRTRLATVTREQMREEVVLLRWSGSSPKGIYPFSDRPL